MHFVKAKSILTPTSMNIYRGCQHGCIYCDARSHCYQMQHDFEDIEVKENTLALLEDALKRKRKPCMIGTGAMGDPYIPLERELRIMRGALELIDRYGFGIALQTKSCDVLRDMDLLRRINDKTKAVVQMTMTCWDDELCRIVEPHVSVTSERFEALKKFRDAGIPTVVWLCPLLPFINDTEENLTGILGMCAEAQVQGIICFGMGLTLRSGNREYYYSQLDRHFPGLKEKYIRLYGDSYEVPSPDSDNLLRLFHQICDETGMMHDNEQIFEYMHRFEDKQQLRFFK
ncbi:MAG: radical SAM protein [Clostridia bacterium]|nr:radical SAM protein [Clostridia bacterium]